MTGFTPEEWRIAARIARRSIFTEGNPDLADAWDKAADQAEARLIPAGGMALTAEQVEDVRAAREELRGYRNFTGYGRSHVNQLIAAVDALFPATEPAEDAPCAICNVNETNHAGVSYYHPFTTEPGPFDDEGNDRPNPAEPAEEETKAEAGLGADSLAHLEISKALCDWIDADPRRSIKGGTPSMLTSVAISALGRAGMKIAVSSPVVEEETKVEDYCCHPKCRFTNWGGSNRKHTRGSDCPIVPKPASSPVVPAPAETGPWKDISEAPKHLTLIDRVGDKWTYDGDNWITSETAILPVLYINRKYAPFVAAKEG